MFSYFFSNHYKELLVIYLKTPLKTQIYGVDIAFLLEKNILYSGPANSHLLTLLVFNLNNHSSVSWIATTSV